jgi:hypothetical protein
VYAIDVFCTNCGCLIIKPSTPAQKLAIMLGQTESLNNHNPLLQIEYAMKPQPEKLPEEKEDSVTEVLKARQGTHGEFRDNSYISRRLRDIILKEIAKRGEVLEPYQEEAIVMSCHKFARIACGNHRLADHWKDISGYAKLASDRLEEDFPGDQ